MKSQQEICGQQLIMTRIHRSRSGITAASEVPAQILFHP
jgi:hypothetical protein